MTTTATLLTQLQLTPGSMVTFSQTTWADFEALLAELGDRRSLRVSYYQGELSLMAPSQRLEHTKELLGDFVKILTEVSGMNLLSLGSMTLKLPAIAGVEPDECFDIQHEPLVRGRTIDLLQDPPPDLAIEVDVSTTSQSKEEIYKTLGVGEFWRYCAEVLTIKILEDGSYREVATSPTFPWLHKSVLYRFLDGCQEEGENPTKRAFKTWLSQFLEPQSKPELKFDCASFDCASEE